MTTATEKPPYRVPLVAETRLEPRNGLRIVSTFSGAGGSCYGFEMAGYETLLASEYVESAADSYRENHPDVPVLTGDVREVEGAEILEAIGLAPGELDLLEGSPPCQPFSTSGRGSKGWGKTTDEGGRRGREDLFFDFARLLAELQPRAFVAENVAGLIRGVAKGYFKRIHAALVDCGYRVEARLLDAQWLGVPQVRRRVIFVGVREDLGLDPAFPDPLPYRYSIRDALPHLTRIGYDGGTHPPGSTWGRKDLVDGSEPAPTIQAAGIFGDSLEGENKYWVEAEPGVSLEGYSVGDEWDRLAPGETSDRYFNLVRPDEGKPLPTVTAIGGASGGIASVTHPTEKRKFSIGELRRLCGFPDDYVLKGSYGQQWACLGNAVPPPMMFHVARALADRVLLV